MSTLEAKRPNRTDMAALDAEIQSVRDERRLGRVIARMNDARLQAIAKRGAWLGNDETHYECTWVLHDIVDLKKVIWIVVRYIENELAADEVLTEMQESGPP